MSTANGETIGPTAEVVNTSMVKPKFLVNQLDLGVVAVGFSGGQVRGSRSLTLSPSLSLLLPLSICLSR